MQIFGGVPNVWGRCGNTFLPKTKWFEVESCTQNGLIKLVTQLCDLSLSMPSREPT